MKRAMFLCVALVMLAMPVAVASVQAGQVACQALGCPGSPPDPVTGCTPPYVVVAGVCAVQTSSTPAVTRPPAVEPEVEVPTAVVIHPVFTG